MGCSLSTNTSMIHLSRRKAHNQLFSKRKKKTKSTELKALEDYRSKVFQIKITAFSRRKCCFAMIFQKKKLPQGRENRVSFCKGSYMINNYITSK